MSEFESELQSFIEIVNDSRQYWFVRTSSGSSYDEFKDQGYIAIGYNDISLEETKIAFEKYQKLGKQKKEAIIRFKEHILSKYPDEKRPMYIGNQLIDFSYQMKKNDVVIIPSESSMTILIGIVTETPLFEATVADISKNTYRRRKKIKWIKELKRGEMESNLLKIIYVHRTITKLDDYLGGFVERSISKVYSKGHQTHFTINVERPDNIGAMALFDCWKEVFDVTKEFGEEVEIDSERESIDIRLNLNSPGPIEFISNYIYAIGLLAFVTAMLIGADIEVNLRIFKLKVKSDGLIARWQQWKNDKNRRKAVESASKKLLSMNVNESQLVDIIKTLSEQNKQSNDNQTPNT